MGNSEQEKDSDRLRQNEELVKKEICLNTDNDDR